MCRGSENDSEFGEWRFNTGVELPVTVEAESLYKSTRLELLNLRHVDLLTRLSKCLSVINANAFPEDPGSNENENQNQAPSAVQLAATAGVSSWINRFSAATAEWCNADHSSTPDEYGYASNNDASCAPCRTHNTLLKEGITLSSRFTTLASRVDVEQPSHPNASIVLPFKAIKDNVGIMRLHLHGEHTPAVYTSAIWDYNYTKTDEEWEEQEYMGGRSYSARKGHCPAQADYQDPEFKGCEHCERTTRIDEGYMKAMKLLTRCTNDDGNVVLTGRQSFAIDTATMFKIDRDFLVDGCRQHQATWISQGLTYDKWREQLRAENEAKRAAEKDEEWNKSYFGKFSNSLLHW